MKGLVTVYKIGIGVTALTCMAAAGAAYATEDNDESSKKLINCIKNRPDLYISNLIGTVIAWPLFWGHVLTMPRKKHTR